jgi:hypothetical protein
VSHDVLLSQCPRQAWQSLWRAALAALAELPGRLRGDAALPGMPLVLDGEVAVFDERLVSRFDLLGEPGSDVATTRPVYIAFDVLHARGRDLRARPAPTKERARRGGETGRETA